MRKICNKNIFKKTSDGEGVISTSDGKGVLSTNDAEWSLLMMERAGVPETGFLPVPWKVREPGVVGAYGRSWECDDGSGGCGR